MMRIMATCVQIQKVSHKHQAILHFMLGNPTVPKGEIARHFGVSQAWLSVVINSAAFQEALADYTDEAFHATVLPLRQKLMAAADAAVDRMNDLIPLESDLDTVRKSADSVLAACGYRSPHTPAPGAPAQYNQQNNYFLGNASPEVLARAREKIGQRDVKELGDAGPYEASGLAPAKELNGERNATMESEDSSDSAGTDLVPRTFGDSSPVVVEGNLYERSNSPGDPRTDPQRSPGSEGSDRPAGLERRGAVSAGEAEGDSGSPSSDPRPVGTGLQSIRPAANPAQRTNRAVEITVHGADW